MSYKAKIRVLLMGVGLALGSTCGASGILLVTSPSWGTITRPTSGTTNYSLSTSSALITITIGSGFSFGDSVLGLYTLSGTPYENVAYSASIGAFTGTGVSVVSTYVNGTTSSGSQTSSVLGTSTLKIGGVLAVTSAATAGSHTATVTVTVNFL